MHYNNDFQWKFSTDYWSKFRKFWRNFATFRNSGEQRECTHCTWRVFWKNDFSTSWCNLLWPLGLLVTLITLECGSKPFKRLQTASNIEKTLLHFCNSDFNSYLDHFQVNLKIMTFSHQRKNIHFFSCDDISTENIESVTLKKILDGHQDGQIHQI